MKHLTFLFAAFAVFAIESAAFAGAGDLKKVDAGPAAGAFSELGSTDNGEALFVQFPAARTADTAIQQAGDALGRRFDAKPQFTGATVDSRSKHKGIASFSGKFRGTDVKGVVLFSVDPNAGASVSVIDTTTGAAAGEVVALMAMLPAQTPMATHTFPDHTGSIDLPAGWMTPSTSAMAEPFGVVGPAGQCIFANSPLVIQTPDCRTMKLYRANVERQKTLRFQQPISPPKGLFYAMASPEEVLKTILPKLQEQMRDQGKPWTEIGEIIEKSGADPNPLVAKSEAGLFYVTAIRHEGATSTPIRQVLRIDVCPVGDGTEEWLVYRGGFVAPDVTFDRDFPLMKEIMASIKLDPEGVRRKIAESNRQFQVSQAEFEKAHQNMLARGRQFQTDQTERFNHFEAGDRARSQARHDANSDFIETINGYRTVYDRETGQASNVNLYNVNAITDGLNAAANDPNRFVQIPLRYQR